VGPPATVAAVTLTGQPGFRIYCAAENVADTCAVWNLPAPNRPPRGRPSGAHRNGRPRYGEDIRETSLVQETQQMHAVSFTKGCYLGQEIVERVRAQGHVNK
jgi:aminomethyltransferase